jgi:hypothetical protein
MPRGQKNKSTESEIHHHQQQSQQQLQRQQNQPQTQQLTTNNVSGRLVIIDNNNPETFSEEKGNKKNSTKESKSKVTKPMSIVSAPPIQSMPDNKDLKVTATTAKSSIEQIKERLLDIIKTSGKDGVLGSFLPTRYQELYNKKLEVLNELGEKMQLKEILASLPNMQIQVEKSQFRYIYTPSPSITTRMPTTSTTSTKTINAKNTSTTTTKETVGKVTTVNTTTITTNNTAGQVEMKKEAATTTATKTTVDPFPILVSMKKSNQNNEIGQSQSNRSNNVHQCCEC